jgi:uncharacterized membrane protein
VAIICFFAIANVLIYLSLPVMLELEEIKFGNVSFTWCNGKNYPLYKIMGYVYLLEANICPFLLMMVSTTVTIRCLMSSRKNLQKISNRDDKKRREKDAKFALNSVVLNISFVTLQVPLVIAYILPINDLATFQVVFDICFFLFCLNYSIGFVIFMLSNSIFRNEFLQMICLGKSNKISSQQSTTSTTTAKR